MTDTLEEARKIVAEQAEDEGLWFDAQTASEAYIQQALRRLHAALEAGTRPDIPLGYTYDGRGNVLTYKGKDGYWYEFTRDIHSNPLTYENRDGHWIKYIRDENGVFLDAESGRGTTPWEQK